MSIAEKSFPQLLWFVFKLSAAIGIVLLALVFATCFGSILLDVFTNPQKYLQNL